MKAPEIKSDDKTLAIRATWMKRWVNSSTGKTIAKGSMLLKDGTLTFADIHGNPLCTIHTIDIKSVRGCLVMLPGGALGFGGTYAATIYIVPKKKQKDLLYFSWNAGGSSSNRGRKYKEWLKAFEELEVPTHTDTYWLSAVVLLFISVTAGLLLRAAHIL